MRVRSFIFKLTCSVAVAALCPSSIAREPLSAPMPIEVTLRGNGPNTHVVGTLIASDEAGLTIRVGEQDKILAWKRLVPVSAFGVKFRLIDKADAGQWLELGRWAWSQGLASEARAALGQARKLNKTLAAQIEAILATAPGSRVADVVSKDADARVAGTKNPADAAAPATRPATESADGVIAKAMQPGYQKGERIVHYSPASQEEIAASLQLTRQRTGEAERTLETKFTEIETAHFLIYTDWDPREFDFLKTQCEGAYSAVATQFNQPVSGNVFVGKLPIFMFGTQKMFERFAREFDEFDASETVLGYFHSSTSEQGHMAMWKPEVETGTGTGGSLDDAMRKWGRTLVHEFSHAFIHRYKSSASIPRWLNEGTAEMIAENLLPTNNYHDKARVAAIDEANVMPLFDDANMPSGYYYPVMMTMAECLAREDKKKFLALFDEIKEGAEPEAALKKVYGIDHLDLAVGWNKYAKALR